MRAKSNGGFTLIELMLAVVVGGITILLGHTLLGGVLNASDRVVSSALEADRNANRKRWLIEAFRNLEVGGDDLGSFVGTQEAVTFSTWMLSGNGWPERSRVQVVLHGDRLVAILPPVDTLVLDEHISGFRWDYLQQPGGRVALVEGLELTLDRAGVGPASTRESTGPTLSSEDRYPAAADRISRMNRKGYVLIAVLWVLTVLGMSVGTLLVVARENAQTTTHRITRIRATWAAQACEAILDHRYSLDSTVMVVDTVELGTNTWCVATIEDPQARLNLNTASSTILRGALGSDSLADALIDWRDSDSIPRPAGAEAQWYRTAGRIHPRNGALIAVQELTSVRGFESRPDTLLAQTFTVSGDGSLNINSASAAVLRYMPFLDVETTARLLTLRRSGRGPQDVAGLLSILNERGRTTLTLLGIDLNRIVTFAPGRLLIHSEGGVRGFHAQINLVTEVVPSSGRLAVLSRRTQ